MHAKAKFHLALFIASSLTVSATASPNPGPNPYDSNLAYKSPFATHPHLAHNTTLLHARHLEAYHARKRSSSNPLHKKQLTGPVEDSTSFPDGHYPTFYGGDFSNSDFVWSGGITFTHSVASGDPLSTSLLIWTRAPPSVVASAEASSSSSTVSSSTLPMVNIPVCVRWMVGGSDDPGVESPLLTSTAYTSADVDYTLKIEVSPLSPDTVYFYKFADCTDGTRVSPVGRTRTIAGSGTPANEVNGGKPMTFAVFSCSQYQTGWFNAYGVAAHNTSADIFVHLGDYIYEYNTGGLLINRQVTGRELATIHDYRQRLAQYRTDASLLAAHEAGPWITVWDDHEIADNTWKAGSANSNDSSLGTPSGCSFSPSGACFTDRKLAAIRAYHEWLPIRQVDADDKLRIWRNFQVGGLLDLTMLDTRQYDRDVTDLYYNTGYVNTLANDTSRSLMGPEQESWLFDTLDQSVSRGAIWRIIGQQIVFTQLNELGTFDLDAWDGYRQNRMRVLDHLYTNKISNTIILSGDSHANWVSDLAHPNDTTTYNSKTGAGAIGVEFAGTAVSSPSAFGPDIPPSAADAVSREIISLSGSDDLQWSEASYRGFFTLTVGVESVNATYYAMQNIQNSNLQSFISANFTVLAGANKLNRPVAGGSVKAGVLRSSVIRA